MLDLKLEGTHVLITGGNKGIGETLVQLFLSQGANVSYCSRSATGTEFDSFLKSTYPQGDGPTASGTAVDIADPTQIEAWVNSAAKKYGRIDTVVANAATIQHDTNALPAWRTSLQADLLGFVALCAAATPHLSSPPSSPSPTPSHPSIILLSTIVAHAATIGEPAPYGPVKVAQHRHAMSLARSLGPKGVRVNVISPGPVESPAIERVRRKEGGEEALRGMVAAIPLGRLGGREDVAEAAVWLASARAGWVSGAELVVDGGLTTFV